MEAKKVLELYAADRRDFRGVNLRGQSFKGKDLSGADFSGADISGTNFTNACLRGTKFLGAKAGLRKRWAAVLVLMSWLLAAASGYFLNFLVIITLFTFLESYIQNNPVGWMFLIANGLFYIIIFRTSFGWGAFAFAFAVAVAMGSYETLNYYPFPFAFPFPFIFPFAFAVALAGGFAGALARAGAGAVVGGGAVAIALTLTVAVSGLRMYRIYGTLIIQSLFFVVPIVVLTILNIYKGWRAVQRYSMFTRGGLVYEGWHGIRELPKDSWLAILAISFAAIGGTCFRGADLTDADFTNATLKNTDLRKATLTGTCWENGEKLDRAEELIKPSAERRRLNSFKFLIILAIVTGIVVREVQVYNYKKIIDNCRGQVQCPERIPALEGLVKAGMKIKDINNADLEKINLKGVHFRKRVNLHDVNLSGANLRKAHLRGADLRGVNLRGADLRGANLSGAFLYGADLSGADLSGANLTGAEFAETYLNRTDLSGADLSRAEFIEADLSGANLSGADLSEADLSGAIITPNQVKEAKNWRQAIYDDGF